MLFGTFFRHRLLEGNRQLGNMTRLDLVSRDEFDAQARVLERTRAQLEALEARLAALEGGAGTKFGGGSAAGG